MNVKERLTGLLLGIFLALSMAVIADDWYEATGKPVQRSTLRSEDLRSEFAAIESNIADKLPVLTGNGSKIVAVNSAGTALEALDDVPVGDGAISNAELRDSPALSVIGRASNSTGVPDDIEAASNNTVLLRTSDTLSFGAIPDLALSSNVPIIETGSFSVTETGLTGSPSATVNYTEIGGIATLLFDSGFLAESNGTVFTLAGLAAAVRPAATRVVPVVLEDNGTSRMGYASITTSTITFSIEQASGNDTLNTGSFTSSGTKGVPDGTVIMYPL